MNSYGYYGMGSCAVVLVCYPIVFHCAILWCAVDSEIFLLKIVCVIFSVLKFRNRVVIIYCIKSL